MTTHIDENARPRTGVVAAATIGMTLEHYDLLVYVIIASLVFNELFFPTGDPFVGTFLALSTIGAAYVARPLGAFIFGHFGDRIGRRRTLLITMLLMGVATVLIGVLPTYDQIGLAAPILLVTLRILQGVSVGGEWGGAVLLVGEYTATRRRGLATAFAQSGIPLGLLLANGVVALVVALTSDEQFLAWGWRIPFLAGAVLVIIGLIIRYRIAETPVFERLQREQQITRTPVVDVFRTSWRTVLLGMGVCLLTYTTYGVWVNFSLPYLNQIDGPTQHGLTGQMVGAAAAIVCAIVAGGLSDRVGRRPVLMIIAIACIGWGFAFFPLLDTGHPVPIVIAIAVGLGLWGGQVGVLGSVLQEIFPPRIRYSGASITYQSAATYGGFVPVIALTILNGFGASIAVSGFVLVALTVAVLCIAAIPETSAARPAAGARPS